MVRQKLANPASPNKQERGWPPRRPPHTVAQHTTRRTPLAMRSFALAACSVCSVAALDSRALAAMDFSQLAAATELENAADPVPSMDMPAQFSAGIILSQTSDLYNQTFTGKIWGSSPSKQQRLSGT
jgi:hypothetical protein